MWLDSVVQACRRSGHRFLVSAHPAQAIPATYPVSPRPMRYLLTKPSILVSRFSTVPFEAMARGIPFVYHNPHGEKVPTFKNPNGAFPISESTDELKEALRDLSDVLDYRQQCASFLLEQVDVDPGKSSEDRTATLLTN